MGFFYRTIRMAENGIKPAYVFDGKPPDLKSGVVRDRARRDPSDTHSSRSDSQSARRRPRRVPRRRRPVRSLRLRRADRAGTVEDMDKLSRRSVKVTREHNEECRKLLKLMGVPYVVVRRPRLSPRLTSQAPSEAEAQCAELCRGGLVYGAGSEDMDTLTFGSPILLRHLTFSEARKLDINVISLADVLEGLNLTMDRFIDVCLLAGCDYLEPLKKIGAKTALKLVREHGSIGDVLEHLATKKNPNPAPDDWPWEAAKELFKHPDVTPCSEITVRRRPV